MWDILDYFAWDIPDYFAIGFIGVGAIWAGAMLYLGRML
jgi:hypothetical protein